MAASRLLRQPGGFEGLLQLVVHRHPSDGAVAERVHDCGVGLGFDPLAPSRAR